MLSKNRNKKKINKNNKPNLNVKDEECSKSYDKGSKYEAENSFTVNYNFKYKEEVRK
jgi:hypothetical protein